MSSSLLSEEGAGMRADEGSGFRVRVRAPNLQISNSPNQGDKVPLRVSRRRVFSPGGPIPTRLQNNRKLRKARCLFCGGAAVVGQARGDRIGQRRPPGALRGKIEPAEPAMVAGRTLRFERRAGLCVRDSCRRVESTIPRIAQRSDAEGRSGPDRGKRGGRRTFAPLADRIGGQRSFAIAGGFGRRSPSAG